MPIPTFFNHYSVAPVSRYPQVRTMRDDYDSGTSSVEGTDSSNDSNVYGESSNSTYLPSTDPLSLSSDDTSDTSNSSSSSSSGIDISSIPLTGVANLLSSITNALGITKPASTVNKTTVINPSTPISVTLKKYLPYILIGGGAIVVYMIVKKKHR